MKAKELQREIDVLRMDLFRTSVTKAEAKEALEFHLLQLERLGATLEDNVCQVLRKVMEQADILARLDEKVEYLRELQRENLGATCY